MLELAWSVGAFIVVVGLLVVVHEFGHFYAARRCGVRVLRFSVGFGRPLWLRHGRDGTEYVIAAVPLGGYVRMLDESDGPVPEGQRAQAFNRKPVGARMAIVVAGPLANFVFAVAAYWLMFVIGIYGLKPELGPVAADSPAAHAGLTAGDTIEAVAGRPVHTWDEVTLGLLDGVLAGDAFALTVRGPTGAASEVNIEVPPGTAKATDPVGRLGLRPVGPRLPARVGAVSPDGPAAVAGFQPGDLLHSANGKPLADWQDWVEVVRRSPARPLDIELTRGAERLVLRLTPERVAGPEGVTGRVGMAPQLESVGREHYVLRRFGPLEAAGAAALKTWEVTGLSLRLLAKMVIGQASVQNVSGPLSIAQFAGESARIGVSHFLSFLALVSVSLGLINLLPIPVLDGGHLMYHGAELIRGAPLSERARAIGQQGGLVILLGLTALALYNDFARLFS